MTVAQQKETLMRNGIPIPASLEHLDGLYQRREMLANQLFAVCEEIKEFDDRAFQDCIELLTQKLR